MNAQEARWITVKARHDFNKDLVVDFHDEYGAAFIGLIEFTEEKIKEEAQKSNYGISIDIIKEMGLNGCNATTYKIARQEFIKHWEKLGFNVSRKHEYIEINWRPQD